MLGRAEALGTGRVRLPAAYNGAASLAYGQPVLVEAQLNGGLQARFLCSASSAAGPSQEDEGAVSFDPSVRCGIHAGAAPVDPAAPALPVTLHPVAAKVATATSLKVRVPASLLGSPLPAARLQQRLVQRQCTVFLSSCVYVHVLEALPAALPATVYRVVPSTAVELVSSDSGSEAGAAGAGAGSAAAPETAAASASSKSPATPAAAGPSSSSRSSRSGGGSSSASKTSRSRTAGGTPGAPASRASSSRAAGGDSGRSSSSSKPKQKRVSKKDDSAGAIAASSSMFDVLDALGDD